ncbi:MAG: 2Fe-2S iron-sulfur cluster-binding protein [Acidimicrobiales bacterium]
MAGAVAAGAVAPPADPGPMPVSEPLVVFTPSGVQARVPAGTTVLDAARSAGVDLDSTCGGRGLCGRCQVVPSFGEFAKWAIASTVEAVNPPTSLETAYSGRRPIEAGARLGCQVVARDDLVVAVPPESQVHRPVVRKVVALDGLTLDPLLTARYVELPAVELGDERTESEMLLAALADQWGVTPTGIEASALPTLHSAIVAGARAVTAVVDRDGIVLHVRPGFDETIHGIAVDVGSTTIAAYLVDLGSGAVVASAGTMNPRSASVRI